MSSRMRILINKQMYSRQYELFDKIYQFNRMKVTSARILLGSALPKSLVSIMQKGNH